MLQIELALFKKLRSDESDKQTAKEADAAASAPGLKQKKKRLVKEKV